MTSMDWREDGAAIDVARRFNWVAQMARWGRRAPDEVALVDGGDDRRVTFRELLERVQHLGGALAARGVGRGTRVIVLMENRLEFVETLLAVNWLGAIAVPVNFRLVSSEVTFIVDDSDACLIVVGDGQAQLVAQARAARPEPTPCLVVGGGDHLDTAGPGAESYELALAAGARSELVAVDEQDPAFIMYTSGTTGLPKGAVLTHLNLDVQAITLARLWRIHDDSAVNLVGSPLFHIGALGGVVPVLLFGGTNVIMPSGPFDAEAVVAAMNHHGVTCCFLVPVQWQAICELDDLPPRATTVEVVAWGAAPASPALLKRMARAFPSASVVATFGQTEMSPITCALDGRDALRKIGSIGRPIPTVDVRIVDESMADVTPGEIGEIVYRGPTVMAGYWRNPEGTAEAFRGGWFHSGDLVRRDDEGFLYVVDRAKDMIISGGENIYSAEVEHVINDHVKVASVAVVGVPHPRWGETPVAVVTPVIASNPPVEEELVAWCRGRLASYKKPSRVVVVDTLPRNATGKVLKTELRRQYARLFKSADEEATPS